MDNMFLLELVSFVFIVAAQTWLIVKYLIDRMDTKMDNEREERSLQSEEIRREVAMFRDTHVRREDFNRHVDNVERQMVNMAAMISQLGNNLNNRLDTLLNMIVTHNKGQSNG